MKILPYKIILLMAIFGWAQLNMFATELAFDKTVNHSKTFAVKSEAYVEIENKYGDVEVNTWDKDSVRVDVEVIAYSDEQDYLDELMEMINIDFKGTTSFVIVETQWQQDLGLIAKSRLRISQELGKNNKIEVNYIIHIPSHLSLEISNKFGNIFLSDYTGNLDIDLAYGDLRAHHLDNVKRIKIKSGKLKVKKIENGHLDLSYAKSVDIEEANDLFIESSSSEITIEKIHELNITSRHDDINIEEVDKMIGKLSLSDVYLEKANSNINVVTKYGTFIIKEISDNAQIIYMEGVKTDFRLGYTPMFAGSIEVDVTEEKNLSYGSDVLLTVDATQEEDHWVGKGVINSAGTTKVTIKSKSGYVQLKGI